MGTKIEIKLFAGLSQKYRAPGGLDLSAPSTVQGVLEALEIPPEKIAIIFIDGRHAELSDMVQPGQTLSLFPPIGGG